MSASQVARAGVDTAKKLIVTGAATVAVNNKAVAIETSLLIDGDVVVSSPVSVFAENKKLAVIGAVTAKGRVVSSGSPTVYAGNNGYVAFTSQNFVHLDKSPKIQLSAAAQSAADTKVSAYVSDPDKYYNALAASDGVKGNYAGTVDDDSKTIGIISITTSSSDIIPFLQKTLAEADNRLWRETGQNGKSSNPNIVAIWNNLGYPSSGAWTTDQTAWCMGFINFALKCSGYRYVQTASAAAITSNPERWKAVQIPKEQARPGDIAFWSYRHVNFVYTANNGKFTFVGGNQSPKGGNNPNDGDVTISYPAGTGANNPNWVSCWRPSKI